MCCMVALLRSFFSPFFFSNSLSRSLAKGVINPGRKRRACTLRCTGVPRRRRLYRCKRCTHPTSSVELALCCDHFVTVSFTLGFFMIAFLLDASGCQRLRLLILPEGMICFYFSSRRSWFMKGLGCNPEFECVNSVV